MSRLLGKDRIGGHHPANNHNNNSGLSRSNSVDKRNRPSAVSAGSRSPFAAALSKSRFDTATGAAANNNGASGGPPLLSNNNNNGPAMAGCPASPRHELGGGVGSGVATTAAGLLKQNQDLRQRLQDEAHNYRRRLDTYKQAQHNQAALVGRLQNKVLQYKQRCTDLEGKVHDVLPITPRTATSGHGASGLLPPPPTSSCAAASTAYSSLPSSTALLDATAVARECRASSGSSDDPEEVVRRLEDERHRCEQLMSHNHVLRQQLEESHRTNEALSVDLQKLTGDWEQMRDDMAAKEEEWKEEEQAFNEYYNSEHSRSLNMWRDVVAVKRLFHDMQVSVRSEMSRMQNHILSASRDVAGACSGVATNVRHAQQSGDAVQQQADRTNDDLRQQIGELRGQYASTKLELQEREHRLQALLGDLKMLEDRCGQAENQALQVNRLADEIERLNAALRDIAHVVVQDADVGTDVDATASAVQHMHLSGGQSASGSAVPPRSPKRGGVRTSQAFAEGTISAVQASLHKYQLLLHDLQVKLQTTGDALQASRKQCAGAEHSRELLTAKVTELTDQLDGSNLQLAELCKERDTLQKAADALRTEKMSVERAKAELGAVLDSLNGDYEKLQNANSRLQKAVDGLDDEKKFGELEMQRVLKDKEIMEMSLRAEEERGSRLREETITLREELNKIYLTRDMLEQQRHESDAMLSHLEKQKMELEYDVDRLSAERAELHSQLESSATSNDSAVHETQQLTAAVAALEAERNALQLQTADQIVDIAALKKELCAAEQQRLDLDAARLALAEKLKCCELDKEKVEQDLSQAARERADLANQLTATVRKKEQICEETARLRQRLEQANEMNNRLNRSLEDLVKEGEEKLVIIDASEKELQRLQELLASLRAEKDSLEAVLFDTNTTLEATENRKDQLDRDVQELLVKQEGLKNHVARLTKELEASERRAQETRLALTAAAAAQETEHKQRYAQLLQREEDAVRKLNDEKEQIRAALEKRMSQALHAMETAKDGEIEALRERYETLQLHLDSLCQQHEEVMIRAENDKQQALLIAHRDKQAVTERLEQVARELAHEQEQLERARREASARADKDRAAIVQLKDEAGRAKQRFDELKLRLEEQIGKLDIQLAALRDERDTAQADGEALKVQLRVAEDRADGLNAQLLDTVRKLKESDIATEAVRKELTDARRSLADSNIERDKYANTNRELRDHVKRVEGQRREQARHIEESLQKIASLEEQRNTSDVDKARLGTLLKETQTQLTKVTQEHQAAQATVGKLQQSGGAKDVAEKELQGRLNNETEERERVCAELHQVRKQLTDVDAALQATRQELGRGRCKANQDEHRWHQREQELLGRMEEGRAREKRLEDQKHNLEVCLADATQQIQELKARLGGAEGRVRALDEQLAMTESGKKEVEGRLSSVGHTLRRIAGIQLDGSVSHAPYRLLSPSRRFSPARGGGGSHHHDYDRASSVAMGGGCDGGAQLDVDPEMVRKGVRTLMQQVAQLEREKDDFKAQLCTAKKQLHESGELATRADNKISKLQQTLRSLQEEKATVASKLAQVQATLAGVEEQLQQRSAELMATRDRAASSELQLAAAVEERAQCEDRLEKQRQVLGRLEHDKRHLQEELARCEGRATKLDLQRVALEGDAQRLQMAVQEKENLVRAVQERLDSQTRAAAQLEDRCVALKSTVDQLKERAQAAAIAETELRGELNCAQKERAEQAHSLLAGQDKLKQAHKQLTSAENERRILAERLEATQTQMHDLRRGQQSQQDQLQRQQELSAELEVQKAALESQLRIAKWSQDTADQMGGGGGGGGSGGGGGGVSMAEEELNKQLLSTQREKAELRGKVEALAEKVRHLENERNGAGLSGGGGGLSKFSGGHVQFDRSEKSLYGGGGGGEYDSNRMMDSEATGSGGGGVGRSGPFNCGLDHSLIEQENRDLRMRVRRLETQIAEKESELARAKAKLFDMPSGKCGGGGPAEADRVRAAQLQAERLLDAREQSHRQQVLRLENQISMLREQLAQEAKRRQMYILRSTRAGREMHQLRQTLGDSLRHVAQDPLDSGLLENETRRLDCAVSMSLPPTSGRDYNDRSISPRSYK